MERFNIDINSINTEGKVVHSEGDYINYKDALNMEKSAYYKGAMDAMDNLSCNYTKQHLDSMWQDSTINNDPRV